MRKTKRLAKRIHRDANVTLKGFSKQNESLYVPGLRAFGTLEDNQNGSRQTTVPNTVQMKTVPSNYKSKTAIAIAMTAVLGVSAQAADNDIKVTWKDSLRLETADGNNKLRIGGRIHWDNAFSSDDDYMSDGDTFRRARLYVSGQIQERYDFKMQYDFAGGDADFKDVYFGIKGVPTLGNIRVGQFKEPFSLEEIASSNNITSIERANVNRLSPSRSAGVMLYNNYADQRVTGAVGIFRGADDSYGNYKGDGYAATARVTGLPYKNDDASQLVHLGIGYSHRDDDTASYKFSSDHAMAPVSYTHLTLPTNREV